MTAAGSRSRGAERQLWACPRCGKRFVTPNMAHSEGFARVDFYGQDDWVSTIDLRDESEIDAELMSLLREARAVGDQEHLRGRSREVSRQAARSADPPWAGPLRRRGGAPASQARPTRVAPQATARSSSPGRSGPSLCSMKKLSPGTTGLAPWRWRPSAMTPDAAPVSQRGLS